MVREQTVGTADRNTTSCTAKTVVSRYGEGPLFRISLSRKSATIKANQG